MPNLPAVKKKLETLDLHGRQHRFTRPWHEFRNYTREPLATRRRCYIASEKFTRCAAVKTNDFDENFRKSMRSSAGNWKTISLSSPRCAHKRSVKTRLTRFQSMDHRIYPVTIQLVDIRLEHVLFLRRIESFCETTRPFVDYWHRF